MYPTFPKGKSDSLPEQITEIVATPSMLAYPNGVYIFGKRYFDYRFSRGDIVSFTNEKTREITARLTGQPAGMVKRVIALPGETIEIRNGLVSINHQVLNEPYTARARSTFGGTFLPECQPLAIPDGKLFVIGDNRKNSGDSRHEIGLINFTDIDHVIPWKKQLGYLDTNWRDTANDVSEQAKITFDSGKYIELINKLRQEAKVKPLKYQKNLELSAKKRAEKILQTADFSFEATRSGYTMTKAMKEVGYSNTTWGEWPIQGYYEAEELINNIVEFPEQKEFLLNEEFQEFGMAAIEGGLNGCPAQVTVQHFAGYRPPNYSKSVINSWETALTKLKEILPSWEGLRQYSSTYQQNNQDVDRMITIIHTRTARIEKIVSRMKNNQWLTNEEQRWIKEDEPLFLQQENLAGKLNSLIWR